LVLNWAAATIAADSLGETKSGILITIQTLMVPIMCDEYGNAPVDYIFTGKAATVECIGLDWSKIKSTQFYRDLLGKTETVGTIYNKDLASNAQYQLLIQENPRGDATPANFQWKAACVFPIVDGELNIRSSVELQQPLRFRVLPDTNGCLFSTVPTYLQ
jgi:hypothetical protein